MVLVMVVVVMAMVSAAVWLCKAIVRATKAEGRVDTAGGHFAGGVLGCILCCEEMLHDILHYQGGGPMAVDIMHRHGAAPLVRDGQCRACKVCIRHL